MHVNKKGQVVLDSQEEVDFVKAKRDALGRAILNEALEAEKPLVFMTGNHPFLAMSKAKGFFLGDRDGNPLAEDDREAVKKKIEEVWGVSADSAAILVDKKPEGLKND